MVTLAIESSTGSELTYHLGKDMVAVGASASNDVVIRSPGVAPQHIVIQRNGSVFTFVCQQRQVVVLNGERRSRGVLKIGDRIRIGTATLIFKGFRDGELDVQGEDGEGELVPLPEDAPVAAAQTARVPRSRAEVVLFREPQRLAEARRQMVEVFRTGLRSDLVPPLRTYLERVFAERQAMLAWLDDAGRFQPIVSQWSGELPQLPARTFQELALGARWAELRLGARRIVIYPVEGGALRSPAFLLVDGTQETLEEDELILAELSRLLAVSWERVERSGGLYGQWEGSARAATEAQLPGSSHAVRVLREGVLAAARTTFPVLLSGRPGTGRTTVASLIATLHPAGPLPVHTFEGREGDEATLRTALLGRPGEGAGALERAKGGLIVVREVHLLPVGLQRELAAAIQADLDDGYGPAVRWVATTGDDALRLLHENALDEALFGVFQNHLVRVPALEERREDLPLLIVRLLELVAGEQGKEIRGIELETLNSLLTHEFSGQMVELLAELRRLVSATASGEVVRGRVPVGSPAATGSSGMEFDPASTADLLSLDDLKVVIPGVERLVIDRVLRRTKGNQSKAARVLNLSRGALIAKMKEYELPDYRYLRRKRR